MHVVALVQGVDGSKGFSNESALLSACLVRGRGYTVDVRVEPDDAVPSSPRLSLMTQLVPFVARSPVPRLSLVHGGAEQHGDAEDYRRGRKGGSITQTNKRLKALNELLHKRDWLRSAVARELERRQEDVVRLYQDLEAKTNKAQLAAEEESLEIEKTKQKNVTSLFSCCFMEASPDEESIAKQLAQLSDWVNDDVKADGGDKTGGTTTLLSAVHGVKKMFDDKKKDDKENQEYATVSWEECCDLTEASFDNSYSSDLSIGSRMDIPFKVNVSNVLALIMIAYDCYTMASIVIDTENTWNLKKPEADAVKRIGLFDTPSEYFLFTLISYMSAALFYLILAVTALRRARRGTLGKNKDGSAAKLFTWPGMQMKLLGIFGSTMYSPILLQHVKIFVCDYEHGRCSEANSTG
jgi:hypothetical protein